MCGFIGFQGFKNFTTEEVQNILLKMSDVIIHRGPDASGFFIEDKDEIAFAHRRLSIIDISESGKQPMISHNGRFCIVLNGEIYNYLDLKKETEKRNSNKKWKGRSDTEVLLEYISEFGLEESLSKVNGMFAFCLWDLRKKELFLARDRVGEKPLYYLKGNGHFLFGSDLNALKKFPKFNPQISNSSVSEFLNFGYINSPNTIYEGVKQVEPGSYIKFSTKNNSISKKFYWSIDHYIDSYRDSSDQYLESDLESLIKDSISIRSLSSDVDVGAFLSGGYDSSLVVAIMREYSKKPIKTFTVGFENKSYDESVYAKKIANYLNTDHHEIILNNSKLESVIPRIAKIYDQPFADISQIPTLLISEYTSSNVKVALTGDGGDEVFSGYDRYNGGYQLWKRFNGLSNPIKLVLLRLIKFLAEDNFILSKTSKLLPMSLRTSNPSSSLLKFYKALQTNNVMDYYLSVARKSRYIDELFINKNHEYRLKNFWSQNNFLKNKKELMMLYDQKFFLPGDILTKVDRASMANSLEVRIPFLDHRIIEYSWRNIHGTKYNRAKMPLKNLLHKYIPKEYMHRPKMGFTAPINDILKTSLSNWVKDLLSEERIKREGILDHTKVYEVLDGFIKGTQPNKDLIWTLLMLESWLEGV